MLRVRQPHFPQKPPTCWCNFSVFRTQAIDKEPIITVKPRFRKKNRGFISVEKPIHYSCTVKRITNTAENTFRTDKVLIISWVYQCNCTDIDLPNPHYPSKSTISLPPLSKVRCCRPKNSGGYRRDCHTNLALHPTLPNPYYPSKIANTLASLVKGEVLSPEKIRATTGGIVTLTFATHPTLPKPHYPTKSTNTLALLAPVAPNTANFASIFLIQYTNYG